MFMFMFNFKGGAGALLAGGTPARAGRMPALPVRLRVGVAGVLSYSAIPEVHVHVHVQGGAGALGGRVSG